MESPRIPTDAVNLMGSKKEDFSAAAALRSIKIFGATTTLAYGTFRKVGATEFLVQAGTGAYAHTTSGYADIAFPHAFPTALLSVNFTPWGWNNHFWIAAVNLTGFTAGFGADTASYTLSWIAIGY